MFDDKEFSLKALSNPGTLQRDILLELSNRLNGVNVVATPNNGPVYLLEAASSIVSQYANATAKELEFLYPKRATEAKHLYKHMHDFAYSHMVSKPATTHIVMLFDRDYLFAHAQPFTDEHKKVTIPVNTQFNIGGRKYGIYYPIDIKINARTGIISSTYDANDHNPLHTLSSNMISNHQYTRNGINYIALSIPVSQFSRSIYTETIIVEAGFAREYNYNDKFYSARVYTYLNNKWTELDYTLSEDIYDRGKPTAKLHILNEHNKIRVIIPQVYFNTNKVGTKIKVEIYTTEGELDIPITLEEANDCQVNFNIDTIPNSTYSTILNNMPTLIIYPAENRILGGSNGISFDELRERVIYDTLYKSVPISPVEVEKYVTDSGFTLTKYLDNITNRIYYAHKKLTTETSSTVPVTVADIELTTNVIQNTSSILFFADNVITILPKTTYRYLSSNGMCIPLTDSDMHDLNALSKQELADKLNTETHTRMPYHLVIYTDAKYPVAKTFNLNNPSILSIQYVRENIHAAHQMVVTTSNILPHDDGYIINLGISKTEGLKEIDESNIVVLLSLIDKSGNTVYTTATKIDTQETFDVYRVFIPNLYRITADRYFTTNLYTAKNTTVMSDIGLDSIIDVRLMLRPGSVPDLAADVDLSYGIPDEYNDCVTLVKQNLHVTFGKDLSDAIFNTVDVIWSNEKYATWPENVYHTYDHDVYEQDANGNIKIEIVDGKVVTNKLHSRHDVILNEFNQPILKYAEGDYKRDESGRPIVLSEREIVYYAKSLMLDARMYASETPADVEYTKDVSSEITAYVNTVSQIKTGLLENTKLYFQPIRTIGTANFSTGNTITTRLSLELKFSVRYYVSRDTITNNDLLTVIRNKTHTVIEKHMGQPIISMNKMSEQLKSILGSIIASIDLLGINNTPSVQTLFVTDPGAAPMVSSKLVVGSSGLLTMVKDIDIEFLIDE